MGPSLLVHTLKGMLRSGEHESTCIVTQRVAGQGNAKYYTNAVIVDASVSPHMEDGNYEFNYVGQQGAPEVVTRENGIWLNVPPSVKTPPRT